MQKMIVTEFVVGKTVAEDIYDRQGTLLLKAGNKVSMSVVNRLLKYNVVTIWVKR
jgi:hypothetical protein